MKRIAIAAAAGYVATVIAANAAIQHYGIVPVGFGYAAPAGVYFVGLALVLRDYVQWALLFLAGTTEWKLSQAAAELAAEAKRRGKGVHMGRVNSEERFRHAIAIDCDSADGTFIVFGPDVNLARLQSWQDRLPKRQPPHVQFDLLGLIDGGAA